MTPEQRAQAAIAPLLIAIDSDLYGAILNNVTRTIRDAVAEEREACALMAGFFERGGSYGGGLSKAIRAREAK